MECAESPKRCRIRVSGLSHSSGFQSPFQGLNLILSLLKEYKFRKVSRKPGNPGLSPKISLKFLLMPQFKLIVTSRPEDDIQSRSPEHPLSHCL